MAFLQPCSRFHVSSFLGQRPGDDHTSAPHLALTHGRVLVCYHVLTRPRHI